jgi:hypothetical protein
VNHAAKVDLIDTKNGLLLKLTAADLRITAARQKVFVEATKLPSEYKERLLELERRFGHAGLVACIDCLDRTRQ